jgi:hypothetical protein
MCCEQCVELVCHVLGDSPITGGSHDYVNRYSAGRITGGTLLPPRGPLTVEQKLAWVRRWLPMTSAVMDLDRVFDGAERTARY